MTVLWWIGLDGVEELPDVATIDASADALLAKALVWAAELEARSAASRRILTAEEAIEEFLRDETDPSPAIVRTGWPTLDDHLGRPIRAGELVLIAARAGVGKTWALQTWIEETLTYDLAAAAAIFELEMTAGHLGGRLAGHALKLRPGELSKRAREGLTARDVVAASPILGGLVMSDESAGVDQLPDLIRLAGERLGRRPTIIAVDYLGLLRWDGSAQARTYERASENVKKLKAIATRERVVILAAAQLSRSAGSGATRPSLADLRDSGVVEEAADRVIALWRPEQPKDEDSKPKAEESGEIAAAILKNRHGPTGGEFDLCFDEALRIVEKPPEPPPMEFPFEAREAS